MTIWKRRDLTPAEPRDPAYYVTGQRPLSPRVAEAVRAAAGVSLGEGDHEDRDATLAACQREALEALYGPQTAASAMKAIEARGLPAAARWEHAREALGRTSHHE